MAGTKTWLVTGANRGLGLEICRQLLARGEDVLATARRPKEATELAALGPRRLLPLDVGDPVSVADLADALGDDPIDVLVNNAGIGGSGQGIEQLDFAGLERYVSINSLGPLRVTQALLPHLTRGGRRIVASISSNMGSLTNNRDGGAYGYRASKAALNMLNRSLAHELSGRGFVCVVLHPGWVRTDMGGDRAPLSPEESVAGMVRVMDGLGPDLNGAFLDHRGERLPW
ncbi:MAG: SDR family oxidoreductase [Acidobacteriota bacterium]